MSLAKSILPQDKIYVNLTAADKNGKVLNHSFTFNGEGVQLDPQDRPMAYEPKLVIPVARGASKMPLFPMDEYTKNLADGKNGEAAQALADKYADELRAYRASGGSSVQDALVDAVFTFITHYTEVKDAARGGNVWQLTKDRVIVRVPNRATEEQPGAWIVQPSPVWGC